MPPSPSFLRIRYRSDSTRPRSGSSVPGSAGPPTLMRPANLTWAPEIPQRRPPSARFEQLRQIVMFVRQRELQQRAGIGEVAQRLDRYRLARRRPGGAAGLANAG